MHGSDEEIDDQPDAGSDEDFSDDDHKLDHEEVDFSFYVKMNDLPILNIYICDKFSPLKNFTSSWVPWLWYCPC